MGADPEVTLWASISIVIISISDSVSTLVKLALACVHPSIVNISISDSVSTLV